MPIRFLRGRNLQVYGEGPAGRCSKFQQSCRGILYYPYCGHQTDQSAGGIFDETMLDLRRCAGLELSREPFCCAVSVHHRLAAKDRLKMEDLYGEDLMLMRRDWSHYVDQLRDDIWQNHSRIHIVDFDFYSMDAFNRCENSNDVLLVIPGWANVQTSRNHSIISTEQRHSIFSFANPSVRGGFPLIFP